MDIDENEHIRRSLVPEPKSLFLRSIKFHGRMRSVSSWSTHRVSPDTLPGSAYVGFVGLNENVTMWKIDNEFFVRDG